MAEAAETAPAAAPEGMAVDAGKMKVSVKPLKGETFEVEYDPAVKVAELKKLICAAKAEYPAEQQKLIYAGRILVDETAVSEYGIKAGEFVVVMLTKPKTAPAAAPAAAAATPAAAPASGGDAAPAGADAPVSMETAASTMVGGSGAEAAVTQLMEMGFERDQVVRCLQAAFGNPDRAVEFLMSGIPAGMEADAPPGAGGAAPPAAGGAPAAAQGGAGGATPFPAMGGAAPFPAMGQAGGGGGGGGGDAEAAATLAELRSHPRFAELAAMVTQNPQMLAHILPTLAQSNPGLLELIRSNPEAFMRMLAQAGGGEGAQEPADPVEAMLAAAQAGQGGAAPGGMPGAPGGPTVVRLTEEEGAAVARLAELGFDRNYAAQVYMACDKNEELAANVLFDGGMDTSD